MTPDQSTELVQVPAKHDLDHVPESTTTAGPAAGPVDPWLENFRLQPAPEVTVDVAEVTVFRVSKLSRERTPDCFRVKNLELGLQNRTPGSSVLQDLKLEIASVLHDKLRTTQTAATSTQPAATSTQTATISSDLGSWEAFAAAVVDDVAYARAHFETCTPGMSDAAVRHHLALDTLFLVYFFQTKCSSFRIPEFERIGTRRSTKGSIQLVGVSDLMLVENQIPMYLLKNAVRELCKIDDDLKEKQEYYETLSSKSSSQVNESSFMKVVEDELDNILTTAIIYLHRTISGLISGVSGNSNSQKVASYIASHYPRHTPSALETCHHLLDCVYHFLCGHTLPFKTKCPKYVHLDNIPSVARLEDDGIKVDGSTENRLDWIGGSIKLRDSWLRSGSLTLPKLRINQNTLTRLRNLAVYESILVRNNRELHFDDVRLFLGFIVQLCRDIPDWYLLKKRGVFNVAYGDNEVVELWDQCMNELARPNPAPEWVALYSDINNHCRSSWKTWRRRNWGVFCNQPWIFISVSAAFLLLVMTGLQTWFTVVNSSSSKPFWPPSH